MLVRLSRNKKRGAAWLRVGCWVLVAPPDYAEAAASMLGVAVIVAVVVMGAQVSMVGVKIA
jgi:hypothetical protein